MTLHPGAAATLNSYGFYPYLRTQTDDLILKTELFGAKKLIILWVNTYLQHFPTTVRCGVRQGMPDSNIIPNSRTRY